MVEPLVAERGADHDTAIRGGPEMPQPRGEWHTGAVGALVQRRARVAALVWIASAGAGFATGLALARAGETGAGAPAARPATGYAERAPLPNPAGHVAPGDAAGEGPNDGGGEGSSEHAAAPPPPEEDAAHGPTAPAAAGSNVIYDARVPLTRLALDPTELRAAVFKFRGGTRRPLRLRRVGRLVLGQVPYGRVVWLAEMRDGRARLGALSLKDPATWIPRGVRRVAALTVLGCMKCEWRMRVELRLGRMRRTVGPDGGVTYLQPSGFVRYDLPDPGRY
ncbi:MAG: hypothetical protein D6729_02930, partial [Deltaproteobacteria bacterium]